MNSLPSFRQFPVQSGFSASEHAAKIALLESTIRTQPINTHCPLTLEPLSEIPSERLVTIGNPPHQSDCVALLKWLNEKDSHPVYRGRTSSMDKLKTLHCVLRLKQELPVSERIQGDVKTFYSKYLLDLIRPDSQPGVLRSRLSFVAADHTDVGMDDTNDSQSNLFFDTETLYQTNANDAYANDAHANDAYNASNASNAHESNNFWPRAPQNTLKNSRESRNYVDLVPHSY